MRYITQLFLLKCDKTSRTKGSLQECKPKSLFTSITISNRCSESGREIQRTEKPIRKQTNIREIKQNITLETEFYGKDKNRPSKSSIC